MWRRPDTAMSPCTPYFLEQHPVSLPLLALGRNPKEKPLKVPFPHLHLHRALFTPSISCGRPKEASGRQPALVSSEKQRL